MAQSIASTATLLECNHEAEENDNEKLLKTHPTHVNVQSNLHNIRASAGSGHEPPDGLHDEAQNIGQDEPPGNDSRSKPTDFAVWMPVQHHTRKGHVRKGVDPQGSQQEQELPCGGVADLLLVFGAQRVQDKGERFPEPAHDENPCVPLRN
jgi:hypothetical protein